MSKRRPPCIRDGCAHQAAKGKRRCGWHILLESPMEVQEEAAQWRLQRSTEARTRVPATEWPAGMRYCSGCRSFVPLFYARGSRCRACASAAGHRAAVEKKYLWPPGVTYESLLALQGGRCAICRKVPRSRRLAVDHDHDTGWVRGLLCISCNHDLLGAVTDDVRILRNAVYYLTTTPSGYGRQS